MSERYQKISNKLDPKHKHSKKMIAYLSNWMDTRFTIPGTNIKFGLDPILSLIPGIGDLLSTGISVGIMGMILAKGVPFWTAIKMTFNIVIDAIISSVPLIGTIFDVGFKANIRNLKMLEKHLEKNPDGKYYYGVWIVFGLLIVLLIIVFWLLLRILTYILNTIMAPIW